MKTIKELISRLHSSKEFKEDKESYLCTCFLIYENPNEKTWQLDYYNKKNHEITSFIMSEKIEVKKSEEIFQKEKKPIEELNIEKVKIDFNKALELVEKIRKEKYAHETPTKTIVLLQNSDPIWNITLITTTFNLLNIKIDAVTGNILEEKLEPVMSFKK